MIELIPTAIRYPDGVRKVFALKINGRIACDSAGAILYIG